MTTVERDGRPVTLDVPSHVNVVDDVGSLMAVSGQDVMSPIANALGAVDEWELVDEFGLLVTNRITQSASIAGAVPATSTAAHVRVDVSATQGAAILVVDGNGVHRWSKINDRPSAEQRVFDLKLDAPMVGPGRRGLAPNARNVFLTWVFRFAIEQLVKGAVAVQELTVEEGLVVVLPGVDAAKWPSADTCASPRSSDGPLRILLLVHGIFATTMFTFESLSTTAWGKSFLAAAWEKYDAVLGFDHRTLSVDPGVNAARLEALLLELSPRKIEVDVVAHSRGSLVTRSLVEQVLEPGGPIAVGTVVMAGGPNAGTHIAEVENWNDFIDVITNLLTVVDQEYGDGVPNWILLRLLELVKAVVREGIEGVNVPGLAALAPGSEYLDGLNETEVLPTTTQYRAVAANFEPGEIVPRLPWAKRLALLAADLVTDQLLQVSNDVAVDVTSMSQINGNDLGLDDVFPVPTSLGVHHLSYFSTQAVIEKISAWLIR